MSSEKMTCEGCGQQLADGGPVGVYCSNGDCDYEQKIAAEAFRAMRDRRKDAADTATWNNAIRAAAKMADEGMDSHRAIAADIRTLLKPEAKS